MLVSAGGEVRDIAARATTIVTDDSVATVVPNSQFISERVTNWSRPGMLTAYVVSQAQGALALGLQLGESPKR